MVNQVTAEMIQQVDGQLKLLGPLPMLLRIGNVEPVLYQHMLHLICGMWNEIEAVPCTREQRSQFQIRSLYVAISIVEPVLRTLLPPATLASKRVHERLAQLDALNAQAKTAAQDQRGR